MPRSNKKKSRLKSPPESPIKMKMSSSIFEREQDLMFTRAVTSAKKHGINILPGERSSSDGNCAFQAAINNVNNRKCFKEKYPFSPDYYRRLWVTDMKNRTSNDPTWKILPDKEWEAGWNEMLISGVYERAIFGDLMLFGIACGLRKTLLIFNTSLDSPHDPIYVGDPRKFGVEPDTEIPLILAYNLSHYESLLPKTNKDIEETIQLVSKYINGLYTFGKDDIPFLVSEVGSNQSQGLDTQNEDFSIISNNCERDYQPRRKYQKKDEIRIETAESSAKKKIKDMTPDEFKKYKKNKKEEKRNNETDEEAALRRRRDNDRKKAAKLKESQQEKGKRNEKQRKAMASLKEREAPEEKERRNEKQRKVMATLKEKETPEEKEKRNEKQRKAKATLKEKETPEEKEKRNEKQRKAMAKAKNYPKTMFVARNAKKVLYCEQLVPELKDSNDKIGVMNNICAECGALKWKSETSTVCCNGGKVSLTPFPDPPAYLKQLWTADTIEARLFREQSRPFNNALALSSIKVNERKFSDGFTPNVVFQGKVSHIYGPIQAEENETPRFAQLYVVDPAMQHTMRVHNMNLPKSLNKKQIDTITNIMKKLQKVMEEVNPYVKDFKQICEIADDELIQGKLVISCKDRPKGAHERTYNKQTCMSEVSVLTNSQPGDLVLRKRGGGLQFVYDIHPSAQALHFTLLFPFGTDGYNEQTKHVNGDKAKRVTPREFFAFHLNMRDRQSDFLFRARRLFQEYICIAFTTIQSQKLKFHRNNQAALRADTYKNVREVLEGVVPMSDRIHSDDHKMKLGKRIVLPKTFIGSPRWYNSEFQDAMAICREYHKPDFFITMTCNQNWEEIKRELRKGESAQDRPDIVARVFKQKKDQLIKDINANKMFGKVPACLWVIEFQKRGLPHVHILVILSEDHRISTATEVDDVICAELPPNPELFNPGTKEREQAERMEAIVLKNMVHGPCGKENPSSPCMIDGKCSKNYPKQFCSQTVVDADNTYPTYQRLAPKDGGRSIVTCVGGKDYVIDNRWIVPYSPYICLRYNCHTNIELCVSPTAPKYLYKYVYKGSDRAMVRVEIGDDDGSKDEISEFEDLRSIGSSEASWQIFNFNITKKHPAVYSLRCHLEDEHHVVFDASSVQSVIEQQKTTELTGFFEYNLQNPETNVKYVDFPKKFVWKNKGWMIRKASFDTIGRVHSIHPAAGDVFYLRMLLHHHHCMGKTSFQDMKTHEGKVSDISYPLYFVFCLKLSVIRQLFISKDLTPHFIFTKQRYI